MTNSLSYSFNPNSDEHSAFNDYSLDGLLRYMGEKVGWANCAVWLAEQVDHTADELLGDYEGGLQTWWGLGSVFLYELGLKVEVKFEVDQCTITVE